jgi:hypothetical protein
MKKNRSWMQWVSEKTLFYISAVSYLMTLVVNFVANAIPLNQLSTGEISDMYPNYFVPANFTFSIWGVIYTALFVYIYYRLRNLSQSRSTIQTIFFYKVDALFTLTNVMNLLWIISWHYLLMYLSLVFMIGLFVSLLLLVLLIQKQSLPTLIPFRIYFGWITIALIANVTTTIVSDFQTYTWLWNGGEVSEQIMTFLIIIIGLIIGAFTTWKHKDGWYGSVIAWSLFGIYVRHTMSLPDFGITMVANISLFGFLSMVLLILSIKHKFILQSAQKLLK